MRFLLLIAALALAAAQEASSAPAADVDSAMLQAAQAHAAAVNAQLQQAQPSSAPAASAAPPPVAPTAPTALQANAPQASAQQAPVESVQPAMAPLFTFKPLLPYQEPASQPAPANVHPDAAHADVDAHFLAAAQAHSNEVEAKLKAALAATTEAATTPTTVATTPTTAAPTTTTATTTSTTTAAPTTPSGPSTRDIIVQRATEAIAEADSEIKSKPDDAARLQARQERLKALIACLKVETNQLKVCHKTYEEAQKNWTDAHQKRVESLHDKSASLTHKLDKCSESDREASCAAPIKAEEAKVKQEIIKHESQKEHDPLPHRSHKRGCDLLKERIHNFTEFMKLVDPFKALVSAEPVDTSAVSKAQEDLLNKAKAHHDDVAKRSVLCDVISDESKRSKCSIDFQKRMTSLRHRIRYIEKLGDCAGVADSTDRSSCVSAAADRVAKTGPTLSPHCQRRECRKDFDAFYSIVSTAANSGQTDMSNKVTLALAKAREEIEAHKKNMTATCGQKTDQALLDCKKTGEDRLTLLETRFHILEDLEDCSAHADTERRASCTREVLREARKSNRCTHSPETCKEEAAAELAYEQFLSSLQTAVDVVARDTTTREVIQSTVAGLSAPLVKERAQVASRKAACEAMQEKIPRRRCLRSVRRDSRHLSTRQRNVNRLGRCAGHSDLSARARCASQVLRRAQDAAPQGCKHTAESCKHENHVFRAYKSFERHLVRMAGSVSDDEELKVRGEDIRHHLDESKDRMSARCEEIDDAKQQAACAKRVEDYAGKVNAQKRLVREMAQCVDHSEEEQRQACANAIVAKAKQASPKKCHSNACNSQDTARRSFQEFITSLKGIASLVEAATVSVHDVKVKVKQITTKLRTEAARTEEAWRHRCSSKTSSRSRDDCVQKMHHLQTKQSDQMRMVARLQHCASQSTQQRRQECSDRVISHAVDAMPARCRLDECERRNRRRKEFVAFLSDMHDVAKVAADRKTSHADVTEAAEHVSRNIAAEESAVAERKRHCAKISSSKERRDRCYDAVHRGEDDVSFKSDVLRSVKECVDAESGDSVDRRECVDDVLSSARRETPPPCDAEEPSKRRVRRRQHRQHRNSLRQQAEQFVDDLQDLASYVTGSDFSPSEFNKNVEQLDHDATQRLVELQLQKKRCRRISHREKRFECEHKARVFIGEAKSERHYLVSLVACRKQGRASDRALCLKDLVERARGNVPDRVLSHRECLSVNKHVSVAKQFVQELKEGGDMTRAHTHLNAARTRAKKLAHRCRSYESRRLRRECQKRAEEARTRVKNRKLLLERFEVCQQHVSAHRKRTCERETVHRALELVPRRCPLSREHCNRRIQTRRDYEEYLGRLRTISMALEADKVNADLVAAAVKDATTRANLLAQKLATEKKACGTDSDDCVRRVEHATEDLDKRRHFIQMMEQCSREEDKKKRVRCARRVRRHAARLLPKGCRDNAERRYRELRHNHRVFVRALERLGAILAVKGRVDTVAFKQEFKDEAERIRSELASLQRKEKRCRMHKDVSCRAEAIEARAALRSQLRQFGDLKLCAAKTELKDRKTCVEMTVDHAVDRLPRPARSTLECSKARRVRQEYVAFLKELESLHKAVVPTLLKHNVTRITRHLRNELDEADKTTEKKMRDCRDLATARDRLHCHREVKAEARTNAKRRELVHDMHHCATAAGMASDDAKRTSCAQAVHKRAGDRLPKLCRRSTNCARKDVELQEYDAFVERVHVLVESLKNNTKALSAAERELEAQKTRITSRLTRCQVLPSSRTRKVCVQNVKEALQRHEVEQTAVSLIRKCTPTGKNNNKNSGDPVAQAQCAKKVELGVRRARPRGCLRSIQKKMNPRQEIVKLRERLSHCKGNAACRKHVSKLMRIQLQALVRFRRQRFQRTMHELSERRHIYKALDACAGDAACKRPLLRQLKRIFRRQAARRQRRTADLTQLELLRKRMRLCRQARTGQSCRRAVLEDYRRAVVELVESLDEQLRQEALHNFRVHFGSCQVTAVDVDACHKIAVKRYVTRLTALAKDAAQAHYQTAVRMCTLTADPKTCAADAATARTQDAAIAGDDAAAQAAALVRQWNGGKSISGLSVSAVPGTAATATAASSMTEKSSSTAAAATTKPNN